MSKLFKPKKDFTPWYLTTGLVLALLIGIQYISAVPDAGFWIAIGGIFLFFNVLFFLTFTTTSYKITGTDFKYRCLFLFGTIDINKIHKLEIGRTLWVGTKPATGRNGVIIYYNKYDEIYISPENNDDFVRSIQEINPAIELIYHKPSS
ncbi:PH domain-containing protein [Sphingobacterium psychroaquaticum]|uniref:PH domain-containing protein n=1 Tax=Sphingobacterium psychroaquaticum TaxID=561061 RepID=A0A1X7KJ63_9SPHI|nr:PH domain-containing protein [Sphingobacterium psychroaquaticum]SMG41094.1 PH domain-containing protein [Sphingobacterium psychroaquaticum]